MKASMFWQTFLRPSLLCLLLLVLKITGLSSVDTGRIVTQYEGMVGGNVSFYCPVDEAKKLTLLYFQKPGVSGESIFLNGYHSTKSTEGLTQKNTKMDQNKTIMYMFDLTLSDSGEYECHYMYANTNGGEPSMVKIHLTVTALFSKPLLTKTCDERYGNPLDCHVKCESHNGLPKKQIKWNVLGNDSREMDGWKDPRTDEVSSNAGLVNISSTAYFNCSVDNLTVSCSVDGITSDHISVCSSKPPPDKPDTSEKPDPSIILVAAGVVCILVVGFSLVIYIAFRKRETGAAIRPTAGNGHPEEVVVLDNLKAEKLEV